MKGPVIAFNFPKNITIFVNRSKQASLAQVRKSITKVVNHLPLEVMHCNASLLNDIELHVFNLFPKSF